MSNAQPIFNTLISTSNNAMKVSSSGHWDAIVSEKTFNTLESRVEELEKAVKLLSRDLTLESKYPKLKELSDQYKAELEKYQTWERIKND